MVAHLRTQSPLERWQAGLVRAIRDRAWDAYDCEIRMAAGEVNSHLSNASGFGKLDWKLIKAMIWTETGAANPEWKTKPMQIGVPGDPGLMSLLSGKEGGEVILPRAWQLKLTPATIRTIPAHNLRAGIGYLLMRMANFKFRSVVAEDDKEIHKAVVREGDTLERIAKSNGSTTEILQLLNPDAAILRTGQTLQYRRGELRRLITGWRPFTTATIAQRYNGGGDINYAKKLDFAIQLISKGKEVVCA